MGLSYSALATERRKYFKPPEWAEEGERVSGMEHLVFIKGPTTVWGQSPKSLVAYNLIYKYDGYWNTLNHQRASFDVLGLYREVPEEELPWNNGEMWWSDSPYAKVPDNAIQSWLDYHTKQ